MKIDSKRLRELELAEMKLNALEDYGVDNWDGYDDAMREIWKEQEREEKLEQILNEILVVLGSGAYEPSERGAGVAFSEDAEEEAIRIFKDYKVYFKED